MYTICTSAHSRRSRLNRFVIVLGAGAALCLISVGLSSCVTAEEQYQQRLAYTGKPAMHAVTSDRLREIMNDLKYSPYAEGNEAPRTREKAMEDIHSVAGKMVEAAGHIPEAMDSLHLDEHEKEVFLKLAKKLQNESRELESIAWGTGFTAVRSQLDTIDSTCNACHTLFRSRPPAPR
jgi:cytochrome c556